MQENKREKKKNTKQKQHTQSARDKIIDSSDNILDIFFQIILMCTENIDTHKHT